MATSTSDDPVQTAIDLLQGDTFPNGDPDSIEKRGETDFQAKLHRSGKRVYVHSHDLGTQEQLSADGDAKDEEEHVRVEVWSPVEQDAEDAATDARAILEDYWNDRTANTKWNRIRPQTVDDRRHEKTHGEGDQYVYAIDVLFRRDVSLGT